MFRLFPAGVKQGPAHAKLDLEEKSIWQRLRRNISIGVVGAGFSVGIKLVVTILLTRSLKIDDYGRLLIVLNLFVFLDTFFGLRVSDVMFRFFQPLREQGDGYALKRLLLFCLGICLASGLLIFFGVLVFSPWLATHLYSSPGLGSLFNIYALTIIISSFSGVYEPLLRIYDRFSAIVAPQVLGSLLTLALLITYFAVRNGRGYDLRLVVAAFALGSLVQSIPPLLKAFRLVRPFLFEVKGSQGIRAPAEYRRELARCLFNSNLSGSLKLAINPGDVFLLGIFASPTQVALYGLARQLTAPLGLLQNTIQTAITPEITTLIARLRLRQLQRLVARYVWSVFIGGGFLLLGAIWLGRILILQFFAAQYLTSLPVFYCLVIAAWLLLVLLVFRPLAVSLDLLRWLNLALLVSAAIVVLLIVAGRLSALTMAGVQIAEAGVLRLAFSMLVWRKLQLRSLSVSSTGKPQIDYDLDP